MSRPDSLNFNAAFWGLKQDNNLGKNAGVPDNKGASFTKKQQLSSLCESQF